MLCERGIDRHIVNRQGHSVIDLVRDVDIGAEIQSYDPVEEDDIDDRSCPVFILLSHSNSLLTLFYSSPLGYEYIDEGGEESE